MYGYIYKTTNMNTKKVYIGQRKGRFVKWYFGSGVHIKKAVQKYGRIYFIVELITYAKTTKKLNLLEIENIAKYKELLGSSNMYNIAIGGNNTGLPKHKENCCCCCCKNKRKELHKENCNCGVCKGKRGETKGENNSCYRGGITLNKNYCIDCGKIICIYSKRCRNCSPKVVWSLKKKLAEMAKDSNK